jgi:proline dehydrogenase
MDKSPKETLRACWRVLARRAARAYVAGPALSDALEACHRIAGRGFASTICFWNDDGQEPRTVADAYLGALDALGREALDCYLSVKAPPMGFSRELWTEVAERGRRGGVAVHFDSLGPESVDRTFGLIEEGLARHPRLGCTLPGRWRRSVRDTARAAELGLRVRVVKGEFPDASPAELDPRTGFLAVVDRLAGRARFVAVATHDAPLARVALGRLLAAGTPCEMELLFGLPLGRAVRVAREAGVRARLYVPYGHAWLPYCLSKARKNPGLLWWVARDLLVGRALNLARPRGVASVGGASARAVQPVSARSRR